MVQLIFNSPHVQELVRAAWARSFGAQASSDFWVSDQYHSHGKKGLILGSVRSIPGTNLSAQTLDTHDLGKLKVQYQHPLTNHWHIRDRFFERFDFTNEWNNLGYGRIQGLDPIFGITDPSTFTVQGHFQFTPVAYIHSTQSSTTPPIPFAGIFDSPSQSLLWINRAIGTLDGFDWNLVEEFFGSYRNSDLGGIDPIPEFPKQWPGAVTMRIDCDENIASGRPLFELYRKYSVPFSMAIKTNQTIDADGVRLMNEVIDAGGSILTHSHTHAPHWGGSRESAKNEVEASLHILKQHLPHYPIQDAVSPFHQNPLEAIKGLKDAGLRAFVGGIIHNDPDFLFARPGEVPFVPGIFSLSHQCMLHGDTYHDHGNSIQIWVDAFQNAISTRTLFGYLDHPFSNYQYGWKDEDERLSVHEEFLQEMKKVDGLKFLGLKDAIDLASLRTKDNSSLK